MPKMALIIIMVFVASCGGSQILGLRKERSLASVKTKELSLNETQNLSSEIDDKLESLHNYYVMAQKNLLAFDALIEESTLEELYQSGPYLNILAIRSQVQIIENDLHTRDKEALLTERLNQFEKTSLTAKLSMENLKERLSLPHPVPLNLTQADINSAFTQLESSKEFQVYLQNIEHLSHLMKMNARARDKKNKSGDLNNGSIRGDELPSKVWALTFKHEMQTPNKLNDSVYIKVKKTKKNDFDYFKKAPGPEVYQGGDLSSTKDHLIQVIWNIDSLDWIAQTPDKITDRTKKLMKKTYRDAGIILFHDHKRSVEASTTIMKYLKQDDRRACSLGQIVHDMNEGSGTICSKI